MPVPTLGMALTILGFAILSGKGIRPKNADLRGQPSVSGPRSVWHVDCVEAQPKVRIDIRCCCGAVRGWLVGSARSANGVALSFTGHDLGLRLMKGEQWR